MRPLIRFALQQNVLVNVIFIGLTLFAALWAIPKLPIERYPNIPFGSSHHDFVPGRNPGVERLVTDVLEESQRGMENIEFIKSTSIANSFIHIKFIDDTDYDALRRTPPTGATVQNQLPTINGEPLGPVFSIVEVDEWLPVLQVNITSTNEANPIDESSLVLLGKEMRSQLELIEGVKKVLVLGDIARQFVVALDPAKLEQHRVTLQEAVGAMRRTGSAPPSGMLTTEAGERLIKVDLRYRSAEDIMQAVVRRDGTGNVLRIGDLADTAESGVKRFEGQVISTMNGLPAVTCKVLKKPEANAIDIKAEVLKACDVFMESHSDDGIQLTLNLDGTVQIKDGLGVLANSLVLSAVLVMLLLFLFLDRSGGHRTKIGVALGLAASVAVIIAPLMIVKIGALLIMTAFVIGTAEQPSSPFQALPWASPSPCRSSISLAGRSLKSASSA